MTFVLLELLFSVHIVIYTLYRFALIQLSLKYYLACHRNSEIRLRYSDNNNLLYSHETSNCDVPEEIFTLLTINNLNDVETSGLIDFSSLGMEGLITLKFWVRLLGSNIALRRAIPNHRKEE